MKLYHARMVEPKTGARSQQLRKVSSSNLTNVRCRKPSEDGGASIGKKVIILDITLHRESKHVSRECKHVLQTNFSLIIKTYQLRHVYRCQSQWCPVIWNVKQQTSSSKYISTKPQFPVTRLLRRWAHYLFKKLIHWGDHTVQEKLFKLTTSFTVFWVFLIHKFIHVIC